VSRHCTVNLQCYRLQCCVRPSVCGLERMYCG